MAAAVDTQDAATFATGIVILETGIAIMTSETIEIFGMDRFPLDEMLIVTGAAASVILTLEIRELGFAEDTPVLHLLRRVTSGLAENRQAVILT